MFINIKFKWKAMDGIHESKIKREIHDTEDYIEIKDLATGLAEEFVSGKGMVIGEPQVRRCG